MFEDTVTHMGEKELDIHCLAVVAVPDLYGFEGDNSRIRDAKDFCHESGYM